MSGLTNEELIRYDRQIMLDEVGEKGQLRLKNASVAVVGLGGLGSNVALQLTAAGVGNLTLIDYDVVSLANLNRQVLHWEDDIGKLKVESALHKLKRLNSNVNFTSISQKIDTTNINEILRKMNIIADCTDNWTIRYILNEFAVKNAVPFVHSAVFGFDGRATTVIPSVTPCLKCSFPNQMSDKKVPVIGVAPAIIGSIQSNEIIRYLLGLPLLLKNKLLVYSCENLCYNLVNISINPSCPVCIKVQ